MQPQIWPSAASEGEILTHASGYCKVLIAILYLLCTIHVHRTQFTSMLGSQPSDFFSTRTRVIKRLQVSVYALYMYIDIDHVDLTYVVDKNIHVYMYVVFLSYDDDENMSMPTICLVQACLTLWRKHSGPILRRSSAGKSLPLTALLDGDRKVDLFHLNMVYIYGNIYIYTWVYIVYIWYVCMVYVYTVYIFDIHGIDMHGVHLHLQYTSNYRPTPYIIYIYVYF